MEVYQTQIGVMLDKVKFILDTEETVEFFVLEQTKIGGNQYILVTDKEEGDGDALILKEISMPKEQESIYEVVEDDTELKAIASVFENMLDDVELL